MSNVQFQEDSSLAPLTFTREEEDDEMRGVAGFLNKIGLAKSPKQAVLAEFIIVIFCITAAVGLFIFSRHHTTKRAPIPPPIQLLKTIGT